MGLKGIDSPEKYKQKFSETDFWTSIISEIAAKHGLTGSFERATSGSHVVFKVQDTWIKLMAPFYSGDMQYEIAGLNSISKFKLSRTRNFSVPFPRVLFQGELDGWIYAGISNVNGVPIKDFWSTADEQTREGLTSEMADAILNLRRIQADPIVISRFDWNTLIRKQYFEIEEQQRKKELPEAWLSKVKPFVHSFPIETFLCEQPVFSHSDLSYDHFLVDGQSKKISGIIDLADCQLAHPTYELLAPLLFVLKGESKLIDQFLRRTGFYTSVLKNQNPQNHIPKNRLSELLLAWVLLHRYGAIKSFLRKEMESCTPGDLNGLAKLIFPIL